VQYQFRKQDAFVGVFGWNIGVIFFMRARPEDVIPSAPVFGR
jgi:hypothetical protein